MKKMFYFVTFVFGSDKGGYVQLSAQGPVATPKTTRFDNWTYTFFVGAHSPRRAKEGESRPSFGRKPHETAEQGSKSVPIPIDSRPEGARSTRLGCRAERGKAGGSADARGIAV